MDRCAHEEAIDTLLVAIAGLEHHKILWRPRRPKLNLGLCDELEGVLREGILGSIAPIEASGEEEVARRWLRSLRWPWRAIWQRA